VVNNITRTLVQPLVGRCVTVNSKNFPDGLVVTFGFTGNLTEEIEKDFLDLFSQSLSDPIKSVLLDFSGLQRLNSIGVRSLLSLIQLIPEHVPVEYHNCVAEFIEQVNLLPFFLERGEMKSLRIEELCPNSHASFKRNLLIGTDLIPSQDVMAQVRNIPKKHCSQCGSELEQSEVASIFYAFLACIKKK